MFVRLKFDEASVIYYHQHLLISGTALYIAMVAPRLCPQLLHLTYSWLAFTQASAAIYSKATLRETQMCCSVFGQHLRCLEAHHLVAFTKTLIAWFQCLPS